MWWNSNISRAKIQGTYQGFNFDFYYANHQMDVSDKRLNKFNFIFSESSNK